MISRIMAEISHWNTIYENLFTGFVLIITTFLAIRLKYKIFGFISYFDMIIPMLFLNLHQKEILLNGMISYILPLLWLFIAFWIMELNYPLRDILLLIIVFLSTYSSIHGLFVNIICISFYIKKMLTEYNLQNKFYIGMIVVIFLVSLSYLINYPLYGTDFSIPAVNQFLEFPIRMINQVVGLKLPFPYYFILPSLLLISLSYSLHIFLKKRNMTLFPIMCLYSFSFLFIFSVLFGRIKFGINMANMGRYVIYNALLLYASYLTFCLFPRKKIKIFVFIIIIFPLLLLSFINQHKYYEFAEIDKQDRIKWKECYLNYKSVATCNKITKFTVLKYHEDFLQKELNLLEQKGISFFAEIN